jgi:hypothetical protein
MDVRRQACVSGARAYKARKAVPVNKAKDNAETLSVQRFAEEFFSCLLDGGTKRWNKASYTSGV